MQKNKDFTMLFAVFVIILFAIFTAIYFFNSNNITNNTTNNNNNNNNNNNDDNINSAIYHEHTAQNSNLENYNNHTINIQKAYEEIATYTTNIYDKDENRMYNIQLACSRLDGHIVAPQKEFSFNNTMGNMGAADGYKKSIGFDSNGKKIKMYGGGICQISSTLYNAVLIANLKVTERHAHSRRVYYVPKDKDATVYSGGPDFKFINTTNSNIMICTYTDGYTVTVTLKQENIEISV